MSELACKTISVSGPDAFEFLQNLLTNDVTLLETETEILVALCNPKGRVIWFGTVHTTETGYAMSVATDLAEDIVQRLTMFRFRSKVEFTIEEGGTVDMAKTRLVNLYLTIQENDKALELLRELRTVLPESYNVDITISRILLSQKKYDEAIMILEDVLLTNPELTVVRYLLAMSYYKNNNNLRAEQQLRDIPDESNLHEDSIFLWVRILSERDNYAGAIELLEKQIGDAGTRKPSFYMILASLYRENEAVEHGKKVYEQALRLYPEDVGLLYNYGIFLEKIGESDDAMAKMQEVVALDPDNGAALNYVGYSWADNNLNLDMALEYIKKAVDLMPDDGYIRDSLGWVYFKMGDVEQAIIELEKASEMVQDDPVIKEHLGDVYLQINQPEKALAAYEASFELYKEKEKKKNVTDKINSLKSRGAR